MINLIVLVLILEIACIVKILVAQFVVFLLCMTNVSHHDSKTSIKDFIFYI